MYNICDLLLYKVIKSSKCEESSNLHCENQSKNIVRKCLMNLSRIHKIIK